MAEYRFLRILGGDPQGGIVIKNDKFGGSNYASIPSDHVYEIGAFDTPEGQRMGVQRMDTLPYMGETIKINPSIIVFETVIPPNSAIIKFIDDGNVKAAEKTTGLILS